jgi:hypothetical protein
MTLQKQDNWTPATLRDEDVEPCIPFILTQSERTHAAIIRCDIERLQRSFRCPEGLEVGEASQSEWDEAVRAFRV